METLSPVNQQLVFSLRRVTERAATAAFNWIGRGDSEDAGRAALDAMRSALAEIDIDAVVAIGEATRGEAPQPQRGERLGRPSSSFKADIAVDPVEGTSYLVRGQTNALAVLAVATRGAMMNPGPAFYMEKFVASAPAATRSTLAGRPRRSSPCSPISSTKLSLSSPCSCSRSRVIASWLSASWRPARASRFIQPATSPAR